MTDEERKQVEEEKRRVAEEAAERARKEEKQKLYADIEKRDAETKRLQAEIDERDRKAGQAAMDALPAEQRFAAQLQSIQMDLGKAREENQAIRAEAQQSVRQLGLTAYRERALRDVPEEVHDLVVFGPDETSIDLSTDRAIASYQTMEARLREKIQQQYAATPPVQGPYGQGLIAAPPQNPAYIQPMPYQGAGLPTYTNPQPVAESGEPGREDIHAMTTEEAVRSGRYGGEMRERILQQFRGAQYPGQLGTAPRHWATPQPASMPTQYLHQGVQQPMGTPMGPVAPPGYPQQPMAYPQGYPPAAPPFQAAPQVAGGARAQAMAAVQRTHQGANPILGENPGSAQALAASQAYSNGVVVLGDGSVAQNAPAPQTPSQVFAQRFAPSPPIAPQGRA